MFPPSMRNLLRAGWHAPDRLLHPARRAHLVRSLGAAPLSRVGFVCHGNICRSPYAAVAARRVLEHAGLQVHEIWSAGFVGPDRPSPKTAQDAARERGYDLGPHRSRLVAPELIVTTDWVFVMEPWQVRLVSQGAGRCRVANLGDLDSAPIDTRAIPDPIDRPIESFRTCYDRIDRCIRTFADALSREPAPH